MRTRATFVLDEELLIKLKMKAIQERKSYSECLEELIKNSKVKKK